MILSRYVHEMSRVPLILYFNDSAKIKFPKLYDIYLNNLNKNYPVTLSQLPSTILDIFGIKFIEKSFLIPSKIGEDNRNIEFPILKKKDHEISLDVRKYNFKNLYNDQHNFFQQFNK